MPDQIQQRLRMMERKQPSQNAHPQSLRKSLADMLYFSDRSGRVSIVPQITSHTPEGYYELIGYSMVPCGSADILLMAEYDECVRKWGSKARGFFLGSPDRELGTIVYTKEEIEQVPANSALWWAGIYAHF